MPLTIEIVPARYQGQRFKTARVLVAGQWFDLGLADTTRATDPAAAVLILRNLHQRAGGRSGTDVRDDATELCSACREMTGWKPREPKRRVLRRRAGWHWKSL